MSVPFLFGFVILLRIGQVDTIPIRNIVRVFGTARRFEDDLSDTPCFDNVFCDAS